MEVLVKNLENQLSALVTDKETEVAKALNSINRKLDSEIVARQKTIENHEVELKRLSLILEERNSHILQLNEKLVECKQSAEGNKQLINKLLNDIERLQQDIDWYKRTYEKRSFWGTVKEKILGRAE